LFRFALLRVGRREIAEDLVQETLLAALKARDEFAGASSERTWLIGILKRKVVDVFRRRARSGELEAATGGDEGFDQRGCWAVEVPRWSGSPESLLRDAEFREALAACMSALPDRLRAAITLREIDGVPSDEVCKVLEVSPTNLWTLIHRARNRLRECLTAKWFKEER
jgi:RNA polymerase sigma-70 factor (ECF subfamily)